MSAEFDVSHLTNNKTSINTPNKSKSANLNKLTIESKDAPKIVFNFTSGIFTSAYKTSALLRAYLELDERARILAFCFRYIAKQAQIDKVDLCTLPPLSYVLMTVYFLQKIKPSVLPVLHEIIDSKQLLNR